MVTSDRGPLNSAYWLPAALLLAIPLGVGWACWVYPTSHLEGQGIDIVHHAIMVHEQAREGGPRQAVLGPMWIYPMTSHWLAAGAVPWCGDPVLALRGAAWVALLWVYTFQLALFRRFSSWPVAVLLLVLMQLVSVYFKVGTINYVMWEGQYNYSRLMGAVGFWGCLYLLTLPMRGFWSSTACTIGALALACFSFQCHLATGVPSLVAIAAYGTLAAMESRRWVYLLLPGFAAITTLLLLRFSGAWQMMSGNANDDGWLPVRLPVVLGVFATGIALVVLGRWIRRSVDRREETEEWLQVERVLGGALLAVTSLQLLLTYRFLQGTAAAYAVKTVLFLSVPLALLLLLLWIQRIVPRETQISRAGGIGLLALILVVVHVGSIRRYDLGLLYDVGIASANSSERRGRVLPPLDTLPQSILARAHALDFPPNGLYLDPVQPMGSYYLNMVAFRCNHYLCTTAKNRIEKEGTRCVFGHPGVTVVLLPRSADPGQLWGDGIVGSAGSDFWHCQVASCVASPTPNLPVDKP